MSKRSIENPEVPGLEDILPPPLPPLPKNIPMPPKATTPQFQENVVQIHPPECQPLYMPPPQPVAQMVPWWIPVDADSTGIYSQWSDHQPEIYSHEIKAKKDVPINSNKRKIEPVDPAKDAAKVASAQSELSALMKPLKCDLCNAVMNSTLQAKLHYDGKPHQKKVSMFLNQSVKRLKTDEGPVTTASDWSSYCDVCKTWFTSEADASQHYSGKKHIRATTGAPKKKSPKKNAGSSVPVDPTARFGIGLGFQLETPNSTMIHEEPGISPITSMNDPQMYNQTATTFSGALRCDLCGVTANRLEQLETHKRGIRHQKMLKSNGMIPVETVISHEQVLSSTTIDYSICRTPSGSYYCAPCDKSFTSENSFAQHMESKKHKNQINPKACSGAPGQKSNQEKHKRHKL